MKIKLLIIALLFSLSAFAQGDDMFLVVNKQNKTALAFQSAYAGFSMWRLRPTYNGACIRVRRSSDNTEQDIGFANETLDINALTTFVGAGTGYVTKWYAQFSGADLVQATASNQPTIMVSGVVNKRGSFPCIRFIAANSTTLAGSDTGYPTGVSTVSLVSYEANASGNNEAVVSYGTITATQLVLIGYYLTNIYAGQYSTADLLPGFTQRYNHAFIVKPATTGNWNLWGNHYSLATLSQTTTTTITGSGLKIGGLPSATSWDGDIQEFVLFGSDQTSNRVTIENDVNYRFKIW